MSWVDKPAHQDAIVSLFNRGMSSAVISRELDLSQRYVQRILAGVVGPRPKRKAKSAENRLDNLREIIIALMRQEGRDFTTCELCGGDIPPGKYDIHHTKYDGATYNDLRIVCHTCNTAAENRYLN